MTTSNRRSPRYKVSQVDNMVALTDRETKETRRFWVPELGGYVREIKEGLVGTQNPQVCDGLKSMGSTLRSSREDLLECIRQEAKMFYKNKDA